jgi:hypothetical protein
MMIFIVSLSSTKNIKKYQLLECTLENKKFIKGNIKKGLYRMIKIG